MLDLSRSGARLALFATGAFVGGTVLLALEGARKPRLGVVKWAKPHVDGTIVGVEFLQELEPTSGVSDLDDEVVVVDDATPLQDEITQIRAVPVRVVGIVRLVA